MLEHLAASPYVYLRVKTSRGEVWAAVPETKIENGAEVTVFNPMLMTKFESKSLKRTFDEVYFGTLTPAGVAEGGAGDNPHAGVAQTAAVEVGKVEKAAGAEGRTVAETWAQKAMLAGKTVAIRGMVVKFNPAVMGKNWIHLQDGSGDAGKGTNDITVTSMEEVAKGQTVTLKGNPAHQQGFRFRLHLRDHRRGREDREELGVNRQVRQGRASSDARLYCLAPRRGISRRADPTRRRSCPRRRSSRPP